MRKLSLLHRETLDRGLVELGARLRALEEGTCRREGPGGRT